MDFLDITYLKEGNYKQKIAYELLVKHNILGVLSPSNPILVGTIPIGIDIQSSDLDIICHYHDENIFFEELKRLFSDKKDFKIEKRENNAEKYIIASFYIDNFEIEVFGQAIPTTLQNAYKHLIIEWAILQKEGEEFRQKVVALKQQGLKTEPAFASLLGITGDPYDELLRYGEENGIL